MEIDALKSWIHLLLTTLSPRPSASLSTVKSVLGNDCDIRAYDWVTLHLPSSLPDNVEYYNARRSINRPITLHLHSHPILFMLWHSLNAYPLAKARSNSVFRSGLERNGTDARTSLQQIRVQVLIYTKILSSLNSAQATSACSSLVLRLLSELYSSYISRLTHPRVISSDDDEYLYSFLSAVALVILLKHYIHDLLLLKFEVA